MSNCGIYTAMSFLVNIRIYIDMFQNAHCITAIVLGKGYHTMLMLLGYLL